MAPSLLCFTLIYFEQNTAYNWFDSVLTLFVETLLAQFYNVVDGSYGRSSRVQILGNMLAQSFAKSDILKIDLPHNYIFQFVNNWPKLRTLLFGIWRKLWNLVEVVTFGWNSEIWLFGVGHWLWHIHIQCILYIYICTMIMINIGSARTGACLLACCTAYYSQLQSRGGSDPPQRLLLSATIPSVAPGRLPWVELIISHRNTLLTV